MKMIIAALIVCASFLGSAQNVISATEAHITINAQTTREQLSQLRIDLHAQGIEFNYYPNFDGARHLVGLQYTISANNGQLVGNGEHKTLQNPNASLTFHINKTAGTFNEEVLGDLTRH